MENILFTGYSLGNMKLKNRLVMAPMTRSRAINNIPNDLMAEYYKQRSGAGLIITEELSVHSTDRAYEKSIEAFRSEAIPGFKKITRAVHEYETKIFAQLNHNGQQCNGALSRLPAWAPSSVPDPMFREMPKEMAASSDLAPTGSDLASQTSHQAPDGPLTRLPWPWMADA